jgi:hypothetical protein
VLLTATQVSDITGAQFTEDPSDNTITASPEPSGCAALDDFASEAKASEDGKASADFSSADQTLNVEEQLTFVPGKGAALFSQLKSALDQCDTLSAGGVSLKLTLQSDPAVQNADDTLAVTATTSDSGQSAVVTLLLARFGDNIVQVTYSAFSTGAAPDAADSQLLVEAATKAEPALS